jgi:hypothetical protein
MVARPTARHRGQARLLQCHENIANAASLNPGKVRNLHGRQRLDLNLGEAFTQTPDHVGVVRQSQLGMETSYDMELPRGAALRLARFLEHFLEGPGIGTVLLLQARKGAEDAGLPEHADVGRVKVLIGREKHPVTVPPLVGPVSQFS